ncbi:hypothetical protein OESDEN_18552 [Oesophagostomum dentatum]|uniref:Protein kinase domain-containing protein n=1 Tax=Oesophagostomum dentatum TaxID=61180 RepID=A0A0B1SEY5_OESDE|nr:hypothetical protein OESDEN_18552 [Oesophagostomum dentatum]
MESSSSITQSFSIQWMRSSSIFRATFLKIRRKKVLLRTGITLAPWEFKTRDIRVGEYVGGQGVVDICKCLIKIDGKDKSAALIAIKGQTQKSWDMLKTEGHQCRLLRTLSHPCVIKFYGICVVTPPCRFLLEFVPGKL